MFEEIFHLMSQLGLAAAARPLCDLLLDLTGESMSLQQLQQQVRDVLRQHGGVHCAEAVICALMELGYADLVEPADEYSEDDDEDADAAVMPPGISPIGDSAMLGGTECIVIGEPCASEGIHETARGWLDIDGGIYFDVRQHGLRTDPER